MRTVWFSKLLLMSLAVSGCASNDLYLASYSRAAIDASTDGAGIGVKSGYLHVTPTKEDGTAYTVLGTSDIDLSISKTVIDEVLATGIAAICASVPPTDPPVLDQEGKINEAWSVFSNGRNENARNRPTLIFGSFSSFSLVDLSWADATSQGITFGYKRSTGMKIPVQSGADEIGSAYARVTVNNTEDKGLTDTRTQTGGIRTTHTFATGIAAIIKASSNAKTLNGLPAEATDAIGCKVQ